MSTSEYIKSDRLTSPGGPSSPCTISPRSQEDRYSVLRSFQVLYTRRVPLRSISVGLIIQFQRTDHTRPRGFESDHGSEPEGKRLEQCRSTASDRSLQARHHP